MSGLSYDTIAAWSCGRKEPTRESFLRYLAVLHLDEDQFKIKYGRKGWPLRTPLPPYPTS